MIVNAPDMIMNFHRDSCFYQLKIDQALSILDDFFNKNLEAQINKPKQELNLLFNSSEVPHFNDSFPDVMLHIFLELSEKASHHEVLLKLFLLITCNDESVEKEKIRGIDELIRNQLKNEESKDDLQ